MSEQLSGKETHLFLPQPPLQFRELDFSNEDVRQSFAHAQLHRLHNLAQLSRDPSGRYKAKQKTTNPFGPYGQTVEEKLTNEEKETLRRKGIFSIHIELEELGLEVLATATVRSAQEEDALQIAESADIFVRSLIGKKVSS